MSREIIKFIFIYDNKINTYEHILKINCTFEKSNNYKFLDKISIHGLNLFLRDFNIQNDYKIDFMILLRGMYYNMYAECSTLSNTEYKFVLEPIYNIVVDEQLIYDNVFITNSCKSKNIIINENITVFKIIDDGITPFNIYDYNILDNLPNSIQEIYLLYNILEPINNLPFFITKIYVYKNCNTSLIKIPFGCEIIKI